MFLDWVLIIGKVVIFFLFKLEFDLVVFFKSCECK